MLKTKYLFNTAFFSVLLMLALHSKASNLFDFPVVDLINGETPSLSHDKKINVVLFFEPDCSWCFKQTKVFNQFIKNCSADIQFVGVGVNGNRQQIKKEIWRQRADFPMYMASKEMLKATGEIATTPLTLLLDNSGEIVTHVRGYLPADQWQSFLNNKAGIKPACS